jgi:NADPH-dependent 2,4-dienoyl-CoA reductase/sulfur reductase-like enzyme
MNRQVALASGSARGDRRGGAMTGVQAMDSHSQPGHEQAGHRHRVAIVGAGFGGLHAAHALRRADVDVMVIDRTNHHLFQPLLYQMATGIPRACGTHWSTNPRDLTAIVHPPMEHRAI